MKNAITVIVEISKFTSAISKIANRVIKGFIALAVRKSIESIDMITLQSKRHKI
jgi:hypothetical protein